MTMTPDNTTRLYSSIPLPTLVVGIVSLLLLLGAATWWLLQPRDAVLFRAIDSGSANEVTAVLQELGIPYEFSENGTELLIPAGQLLTTRMELAARGIPGKGSVGFELFSEADYGMTDFAQKVNFQRALQGELERTIASLEEVRSARVHLTLRKSAVFFRDREAPKASVAIATVDDIPLSPIQVAGIQHLIASSVEGMTADAVVVLDHRGVPVGGTHSSAMATSGIASQLDEKQRVEAALKEKIMALLATSLAPDSFSVSVTAQLNFDHIKETREKVLTQSNDGAGAVARRTEKRSNPAGPDEGSAGITAAEIEYALGKSVEEVVYAPGGIEKLTIGVLVSGGPTEAVLERLRTLVAAAAGIDSARGDHVVVTAIPEPLATQIPVPAVIPAVVESTTISQSATEHQASSFMTALPFNLPALIGSAAVVIVLVFVIFIAVMRRKAPKRMNRSEREAALRDIRVWLEDAA